jgi:hypothetical protein
VAPLDEWSVRHRDLYLTTNNTHERQILKPPAGFEPAIPASERPLGSAYTRKHVKEMEITAVYTSLTTSTADYIRCNCSHYHFKVMIWLIIWRKEHSACLRPSYVPWSNLVCYVENSIVRCERVTHSHAHIDSYWHLVNDSVGGHAESSSTVGMKRKLKLTYKKKERKRKYGNVKYAYVTGNIHEYEPHRPSECKLKYRLYNIVTSPAVLLLKYIAQYPFIHFSLDWYLKEPPSHSPCSQHFLQFHTFDAE